MVEPFTGSSGVAMVNQQEDPIRHHPKYHSWGDYDSIVGGGDDDGGERGGRAHKENIKS
jgi:hypothetical protein